MIRAWRFAGAEAVDEPAAWIRVIARREALRLLEGAQREAIRAQRAGEAGAFVRTRPADSTDGDTDALGVLRILTVQDREIFLRHYWAQQSCEEIAAAVSLPVGTVKVRLSRGRARLRDALSSST